MARERIAWAIDMGIGIPGHELTAMACEYPDTIDGGFDLCLPVRCAEHHRSLWWCLNVAALWCDGGPPDYDYHLCVNFK